MNLEKMNMENEFDNFEDPALFNSSGPVEKPKRMDTLNIMKSPEIIDMLNDGESLVWSGEMYKINKNKRRQTRRFFMTNRRFFNIGKEDFLNKMINVFKKDKCKRSINLYDIESVTFSLTSEEFTLHVPRDYDYRLQSPDRNFFLSSLLYYRDKILEDPIKFYPVDDFDLKKYTRYDKKDKVVTPKCQACQFRYTEFVNYSKSFSEEYRENIRSSETVFNRMHSSSMNEIKLTFDDFTALKTIGRGGFGKVVLCQKKDNKKLYAIKILKKSDIMQKDHMDKIRNEKNIMKENKHKFLLGLEFCFHDGQRIYFGMNFCAGGVLTNYILKYRRFDENVARFYAAQIILALEYLHERNIVYRDLKPDNVCLDKTGYIKLIDYGISKYLAGADSLTQSVVGTYEYFAPEILQQQGYNRMVDWWCLGILLYEIVVGQPPWTDPNDNTLFTQILKYDFEIPKEINMSPELMHLIRSLLIKAPSARLGFTNGAKDIINHPWFTGFDFNALNTMKMTPSLLPYVVEDSDVSNIDPFFTQQSPHNTCDAFPSLNYTKEFEGFDYIKPTKATAKIDIEKY